MKKERLNTLHNEERKKDVNFPIHMTSLSVRFYGPTPSLRVIEAAEGWLFLLNHHLLVDWESKQVIFYLPISTRAGFEFGVALPYWLPTTARVSSST